MDKYVDFFGETRALQLFGVKLVGVNAENGKKLLFTVVLVVVVMVISRRCGGWRAV